MKYGSYIIEKREYVYIKRLLNISGYDHTLAHKLALEKLKHKIEDAIIVEENEMPLEIIRINGSVKIKCLRNSSVMPLQIVIPIDEDLKKQKFSILSPLPVSLIGYSKGDIVNLTFSKDKEEQYIIEEVKQDTTANQLDIPI